MRKYRIVFQKAFKSQMIYRAATLSSAASTLLSFAIQICLWHALLGTGLQSGTSFTDMVLFVIVNTFVSKLTRANIATTIEAAVTDGSIAMELLRPISYKYYLLANIFGKNAFSVMTNVLPVAAVGAFFLGGAEAPEIGSVLAFLVSLQTVSYVLPFRYVAFEPVNLLLGRTPAGEAWVPILCALAWLLVLGLLDRVMWRSAVQGLTVNGG